VIREECARGISERSGGAEGNRIQRNSPASVLVSLTTRYHVAREGRSLVFVPNTSVPRVRIIRYVSKERDDAGQGPSKQNYLHSSQGQVTGKVAWVVP